MDFEEAGRRLKLAAILCVAGYGGWYILLRGVGSAENRAALEREEPSGTVAIASDGREIQVSSRVEQAGNLGFKDPVAGLAALRAIVAAPKDADEKDLADKRLGGLLLDAHRAAGDARDWHTQAALWAEIASRPAFDVTRRRIMTDDRARWLSRAVSASDDASADTLAAAMIPDTANDDIDGRRALKEWRRRQFEKWRAARASGNAPAVAAALATMSSWEPLNSELSNDLLAASSPAELTALGKSSLKSGAPGAAAMLLLAAARASGDAGLAARALLDDAYFSLASASSPGNLLTRQPPPGVELFERVSGERRPEALLRAAALIEPWADTLAVSEPGAAISFYEHARRLRVQSASLAKLPAPDLKRLDDKIEDARMAATLAKLKGDTENAFAELRVFLRAGKDPARRERALQALRQEWRAARDAKDFDRLVDFSAFWLSEIGAPAHADAFRAELKSALVALADDAKKAALNKQVFALSLLADGFPDDPDARQARRDAAIRGSELARTLSNRGAAPRAIGVSGLPGRTVALFENGTEHHILMVFEGPETFFVRINPYRRGTVVLKDGKYLAGVATVKDEIVPYSFEPSYASSLVQQKFVIVTKIGGSTTGGSGFGAYGNWTVLRAPDGETYTADPNTGRVKR